MEDTLSNLARNYGLSYQSMFQAAKSGTLKARQVHGAWVTTLQDLVAWAHEHATAPTARKLDEAVASHQMPDLDYPDWYKIFNDQGQERIRPVISPDDELLGMFSKHGPAPAYEIVRMTSNIHGMAFEFASARNLLTAQAQFTPLDALSMPPWHIQSELRNGQRRWFFYFDDKSRLYFPQEHAA